MSISRGTAASIPGTEREAQARALHAPAGTRDRGICGSLFDVSFTSFVTTKVIKILYVLTLLLLVIGYIAIAIDLFSSGSQTTSMAPDGTFETSSHGNTTLGLLWVFVVGPLFLFFYTLIYRVAFELVIVLFRIFENTRDQLALARAERSHSPTTPGTSPRRTPPNRPTTSDVRAPLASATPDQTTPTPETT
jgi:hypothetical protein